MKRDAVARAHQYGHQGTGGGGSGCDGALGFRRDPAADAAGRGRTAPAFRREGSEFGLDRGNEGTGCRRGATVRDSRGTLFGSGHLNVLTLVPSSRFRKDVKRAESRGKDMAKLRKALTMPARQAALPPECRVHVLRGERIGFRNLLIGPDWVLPCRIDSDGVQIAQTGTRSDLFRK